MGADFLAAGMIKWDADLVDNERWSRWKMRLSLPERVEQLVCGLREKCSL